MPDFSALKDLTGPRFEGGETCFPQVLAPLCSGVPWDGEVYGEDLSPPSRAVSLQDEFTVPRVTVQWASPPHCQVQKASLPLLCPDVPTRLEEVTRAVLWLPSFPHFIFITAPPEILEKRKLKAENDSHKVL